MTLLDALAFLAVPFVVVGLLSLRAGKLARQHDDFAEQVYRNRNVIPFKRKDAA